MLQDDLSPGKTEALASYSNTFYEAKVNERCLVVKRKFPPKTKEIEYGEIASVKHERIVGYGDLYGFLFSVVMLFSFNFFDPIKKLFALLVLEAGNAMGYFTTDVVDPTVMSATTELLGILSLLFILAMFYYCAKFVLSFTQKLVIYRSGKKPLVFPLPLTGDALEVMAKLNEKVKAVAGLSKSEVEKIITEHLDGLLKQRIQMESELLGSLKAQASQAKTKEDRAALKAKMHEGIEKLEEQDKIIDSELRKTGLSKEELFKKYRIKPPKEEFISAVLRDGGMDLGD